MEISEQEFESFIAEGRLRRLSAPIPAQPDHTLWLTTKGAIKYLLLAAIERRRKESAEEFIRLAEKAWEKGDKSETLRWIKAAGAADDRRVEPYILRAAVASRRNETVVVNALKRACARGIGEKAFNILLTDYLKIASSRSAPDGASPGGVHTSAWRGIGAVRPAAYAEPVGI